jgi:hypothetical protein
MADYATMPLEDLHAASASVRDINKRGQIVSTLMQRTMEAKTIAEKETIWPSKQMREREEFAGLYPDPADPQFAARLYQKKEFYEARSVVAGVADGSIDPCSSNAAHSFFELTPVQRVVARFMHPRTPFNGLLLYHGVGVGKTCSAVTIAENFLAQNPMKKVIFLSPQALKENFLKTVFDTSKLTWSSQEGQWKIQQCTGISYLERLNLLNEPDLKTVTFRIMEDIRNRYKVSGYLEFANWLKTQFTEHVPSSLTDKTARATLENELIRRLFSDHMIIIDEAHNLRDLTENPLVPQAQQEETTATGQDADNKAGKALIPLLKRIALYAEGLKIVLMTATPMYNSAPEIILLLNILLMNDTKKESPMTIEKIFTKEGDLKEGVEILQLEKAARAYVSYMRGENPYTFPLRMRPPLEEDQMPASLRWPEVSATSLEVAFTEQEANALDVLPLIMVPPITGSPAELQLRGATTRGFTADVGDVPIVDKMLDSRMQIANFSYPNGTYGTEGFTQYFSQQNERGAGHQISTFRFRPQEEHPDVDSIFKGDALKAHAPKIHRIIENLIRSKGICFVYSRYINAGALPLAIALERVGFQRRLGDGSISPLLRGSSAVAPICALCGSTNSPEHSADHVFTPACYILLTSSEVLAPQFASLVRQAVTWDKGDPNGPRGTNVKVIIGSQVASEGLDLKCIREVHILDAWYHLNRIDQIIGRAIRYCSHSALPPEERNCLIYLYAVLVEATALGPALETADLYAYRLAISKAQRIGKVQRLLKRHAWDCNLELEAITFAGLPPRRQIDGQGNELNEYDINDQDYTTYCDYQACKHECKVTVRPEDLKIDESSYQFEDARNIIRKKHEQVRRLFKSQVMVPEGIVKDIFSDLPWEIASEALLDLLDGRNFRLTRPDHVEGFLVKKNGYLVFQPALIRDTDIPIALRYARGFQLLRQTVNPSGPVWTRAPPPVSVVRPPQPRVVDGVTVNPGDALYDTAPPPGALPVPPGAALPVPPGAALPPAALPPGAALPPDDPLTLTPELVARWSAWFNYISNFSDVDKSELDPADLDICKLWRWILRKFKEIGDDIITVAIQWWVEGRLTFDEQRIFNEVCLLNKEIVGLDELKKALAKRHFINNSFVAYAIYKPEENEIKFFHLKKTVESQAFKQSPELLSKLFREKLIAPKLDILREAGILFGLISNKDKKSNPTLVFKTVDLSAGLDSKTRGAECYTVSNLTPSIQRVNRLQAAIQEDEASDLLPLLLLPAEPTAKKTEEDKYYINQLTRNDFCLYLEFLTRLLDVMKFQGKRWFLDAIDASVSWGK